MAITSNNRNPISVARGRNNSSTEPKDKAKVWLNVGYTHIDEETGEEIFVSLPMGIPLDTMETQVIRGTNEDFQKLTAAKNALLEMLQKMGEDLTDGEEELIEGVQIQIRRVSAPAVVSTRDNQFLSSMGQLGFVRKAS